MKECRGELRYTFLFVSSRFSSEECCTGTTGLFISGRDCWEKKKSDCYCLTCAPTGTLKIFILFPHTILPITRQLPPTSPTWIIMWLLFSCSIICCYLYLGHSLSLTPLTIQSYLVLKIICSNNGFTVPERQKEWSSGNLDLCCLGRFGLTLVKTCPIGDRTITEYMSKFTEQMVKESTLDFLRNANSVNHFFAQVHVRHAALTHTHICMHTPICGQSLLSVMYSNRPVPQSPLIRSISCFRVIMWHLSAFV